jgi:hypothetical protein
MAKLKFQRDDLEGRILSLNTLNAKVFSCGGFSVNYNRPIAIVTKGCEQTSIRRGLAEGKLIDVTDQNVDGLNLGGARHTKPKHTDTGETAFITVDRNGSIMIAIPKDKKEQQQFEDSMAKSDGILRLDTAKISDAPSPLQANRLNAGMSDILLNELANKLDNLRR